jgi:hypothetical protein
MSDTPKTDAIEKQAEGLIPAYALDEFAKLERERDAEIKRAAKLCDISERAIALAALDKENDKYGAVSQLRIDLEQLKDKIK